MVTSPSDLAARIHAFLERHAKIAAAWDPKFDPADERFNGPDSSMLEAAALAIDRGETPPRVFSSWESGCYRDDSGRDEHDALVTAVNDLSRTLAPSTPKGPAT